MTPTIDIGPTSVPVLGFGTWPLDDAEAERAVADALAIGYRHIDTAQGYRNETGVGRALAASRVDRDDVFVTTKIPPREAAHADVHRSHRESLDRLGLDHVDLLLLHWPSDAAPLAETLMAMTELQEAGLTRHIGVSNFPSRLLAEAFDLAPIVTDQMECHPYLGVDAVRAVLRGRGGFLTAYSPLGKGTVLGDPVIGEMAENHGRTPAQVILRWHLQHEATAAIPKSANRARIEENLQIFDFELTDDEVRRIDALERGDRQIDEPGAPEWDEGHVRR